MDIELRTTTGASPIGELEALRKVASEVKGDSIVLHRGDSLVSGALAGGSANRSRPAPRHRFSISAPTSSEALAAGERPERHGRSGATARHRVPVANDGRRCSPARRGRACRQAPRRPDLRRRRSRGLGGATLHPKFLAPRRDSGQRSRRQPSRPRRPGIGLASRLAPARTNRGPGEDRSSKRIEDALVRGPCVIGANVVIRHAYIGPYTSVGDGCLVENAELERSLILNDAIIRDIGWRLEHSLVGARAHLSRDFRVPKAVHLQVGDDARISVS